ncbi:MAG: guanylate kinase [Alphaproteobacteria bacterium]|nr:guanylate kinase [Alphaproteobacteria bacterium]
MAQDGTTGAGSVSSAGGGKIARRGLLFVLSSPSGAGKTTLGQRLRRADPSLELSISATTRPRRQSEIDGQDYHFVTADRFERMAERGEFLEHATVFGNRYGTLREPVIEALDRGRDVLFDVDWQGAAQLAANAREDLVLVFILPPSAAALEQRLRTRAQDSDEVIGHRMSRAAEEIAHWAEYDYVIVNDDLGRAYEEVRAILAAERLKRVRQPGLTPFVERLLAELT